MPIRKGEWSLCVFACMCFFVCTVCEFVWVFPSVDASARDLVCEVCVNVCVCVCVCVCV